MTEVLQRTLSKRVMLSDGTSLPGKQYIANLVKQALETGAITLANGVVMAVSPDDILMLYKFVFAQVDGSPPTNLIHSGDIDNPVIIRTVGFDIDKL